MIWGNPEKKAEEMEQADKTGNLDEEEKASSGEAKIVESDSDNGENETGGAA